MTVIDRQPDEPVGGCAGIQPVRRREWPAFTLIELLVVVAIIALLISILLPALKRARDAAADSVCKVNMHTFGMAAFYYAEENNDWLVPASITRTDSFDVLLDPYLHTLTATSGGLWQCPSDDFPRDPVYVPNPPRSYVINFRLSIDSRYGGKSVKLSRLTGRRMAIFGEYWGAYNGVRSEFGAANFFNGIFAVQLEGPFFGRYHLDKNSNYFLSDHSVEGYSGEAMLANPRMAGDAYYWEDWSKWDE